MAERREPQPPPADRPVTIHISAALLDTARAALPPARDWTGSQITAACVAMAIKRTGRW